MSDEVSFCVAQLIVFVCPGISEFAESKYCLALNNHVYPEPSQKAMPEVKTYSAVETDFWYDRMKQGKIHNHLTLYELKDPQISKKTTKFYMCISNQTPGHVESLNKTVQIKNPHIGPCPVPFCPNKDKVGGTCMLDNHWEFIHQPLVKKFTCTRCDHVCLGYSSLERHLSSAHSDSSKEEAAQDVVEESVPTRFYMHPQHNRYLAIYVFK